MTVEEFLNPVVEQSVALLQLENADGNSVGFDSIVALCANIAYSQLEVYCCRPFIYQEISECYEQATGTLFLRMSPVEEVTSVYFGEELLTVTTDYVVRGDKIVFVGKDKDTPMFYDDTVVLVEYSGGYANVTDNVSLTSAFILQTIANYRRRDIFGLTSQDLGRGLSKTASDGGNIINAVQTLIAPFRFYGETYQC